MIDLKLTDYRALHSSALYTTKKIKSLDEKWNVDNLVRRAIGAGFPKEKINLGLAFYGRSFELTNTNEHVPGSNVKGLASPGTVLKLKKK